MHTVAYLRVSTGGQELESQRLTILDYAQRPS
jgi:DNA invertase Pin-like site-specific DNA recombinase